MNYSDEIQKRFLEHMERIGQDEEQKAKFGQHMKGRAIKDELRNQEKRRYRREEEEWQ